jgi:hypothetical protein
MSPQWAALKLAAKARSIPEVAIVIRVLIGIVGGFVLIPVVSSVLDPTELVVSDYLGLVVFTAVGLSLLRAAFRGSV